jgi:hypothetical protein
MPSVLIEGLVSLFKIPSFLRVFWLVTLYRRRKSEVPKERQNSHLVPCEALPTKIESAMRHFLGLFGPGESREGVCIDQECLWPFGSIIYLSQFGITFFLTHSTAHFGRFLDL